ncbi:KGK domain-containing protein [Anabaena subtropica]|uniref:KGK domain protein n=1 Tax=Anabaena subtropica FACHB-260 TaxID=2692884 RepID=A0ABR8CM10_9NOST|nr:KGK domain-containing protein [Anabaena subtropica]MBD2344282.1 KGK domain protein [Anabaena subtropica FACHB-260]
MEENFNLSNCNDNDALSVKDKVFKIVQVKEGIKKAFSEQLAQELHNALNSYGISIDTGGYLVGNKFYRYTHKWFDEGVDCEVLKPASKGWQTGKLRIKVTIEFIPDESIVNETESPLDDLRRMINE